MSWSGGTYTRTNGVYTGATVWNSDDLASVAILSTRHDTHDQDLAQGINSCLNKDGSNAATANLNLGGFRYTNAAAATASTDLARTSQIMDGSIIYAGTTGGTTTAYTLTPTIAITRTVGMIVRGKINATSTGAATLNVSGTGAANIVARTGSQCPTGTIIINTYMDFMWDGTNWVVVSPVITPFITYSPSSGGASFTITSTALARYKYSFQTHNVIDLQLNITGTTSATPLSVVLSLPQTAIAGDVSTGIFSGTARDGGSAAYKASGLVFLSSSTQLSIYGADSTVAFTNGVSRSVSACGVNYLCA
jgi:hypothetical protein